MKPGILGVAMVAVLSMLVADLMAQPGGGRGGRGGGRGGFGGGGMGMLQSQELQDEIGLEDEQLEELQAMQNDMRSEMMSMFQTIRDLPEDERRAAFEDMRADMESRVQDVLLPQQWERLQQIQLQQQMQRGGNDALTSGRVAEELGLTEEQIEQMREKAAQAQITLQEKVKKAQDEAREEVLSVLTPSQRAKFDALVGKPFEMPEQNRFGQGGRGGRGGQGGRGGFGGGQRGGGRPELE